MIPEKDIPELVEWLMDPVNKGVVEYESEDGVICAFVWGAARWEVEETLTAALKAFNDREVDEDDR